MGSLYPLKNVGLAKADQDQKEIEKGGVASSASAWGDSDAEGKKKKPKSKKKNERTKWEIMCCDLEIAILARNILLFTLIIDKASHSSMWNIFYHFYITETDNALLQAQISKLLELSVTLDVWSSSPYGASIRFMNQETIDEIREIWYQYLKVTNLRPGSEERKNFETNFQSEINETIRENHLVKEGSRKGLRKEHAHGLRSTGVHWRRAIRTVVDAFDGFWDHGVIAGNLQDVEALAHIGRRVNPAMAISSGGNTFSVPHSSDPLLGFYLASAFDDENISEEELKVKVVRLAKSQFKEWCMEFGEKVRGEEIIIRLYCGDALRLCYELQSLRGSEKSGTNLLQIYASAWRSTPIILDNFDASNEIHPFDIIDTNNLADPLGILNLLPAISPLLSRKATSTIFTETLYMYTKDPADTLSHILCSDITTMSLLLGLAPTGHLFGYTADAIMGLDIERQLTIHQNNRDSFHMRISWRCPNYEDPVGGELIFEPHELAKFFFKLYLKMFAFDSVPTNIERLVDRQKYNRLSFAALVCLAKDCIKSDDWWTFGKDLFKQIYADKTLYHGTFQIMELSLHFYHLGISSELTTFEVPQEIILTNQKAFKEGPLSVRNGEADVRLLGLQDMPPVVWITLSISREKIGTITTHSKHFTTVALQISIWHINNETEAHFLSLQCFFGSLIQNSKDGHTYEAIEEKSGWNGSSNLVVTCAVPSLLLLADGIDSTRIELAVLDTGSGVKLSGPRTGRSMAICSYRLDDVSVFILKQPPGARLQFVQPKSAATKSSPRLSKQPCFIRMRDDSSISTMEIRNDFQNSKIERATRARQVSPCAISERVDGIEIKRIQFPYPFALHEATIDLSKRLGRYLLNQVRLSIMRDTV